MRSAAVGVLGAALASAYALVIPLGLPYDEPAHWANVRFWAEHWRMPVLGEAGTSYEAQMGPVAYLLDAVIGLGTGTSGREAAAVLAVRLSGLLLLGWLFLLLRSAVGEALDSDRRTATLAAAVAVMNPMLVAVAMSVQNDLLALALAFTGLVLALGRLRPSDRPWICCLGSGLLIGLAVLTKLTVLPAAPAAMYALRRRYRDQGWRLLLGHGAVVATVSGWWFVRNWVLYGDLTGRVGVERAGFHFGALSFDGPSTVAHLGGQVVTYLWLPTEYYRNSINAPGWLVGTVVALTLAVALAGLRAWSVGWQPRVWLGLAVGSGALWLVTVLTVQAVAFRTAYLGLAGWAVMVAAGLQRLPDRFRAPVVLVMLLILHAWTLHAAAGANFATGVQL